MVWCNYLCSPHDGRPERAAVVDILCSNIRAKVASLGRAPATQAAPAHHTVRSTQKPPRASVSTGLSGKCSGTCCLTTPFEWRGQNAQPTSLSPRTSSCAPRMAAALKMRRPWLCTLFPALAARTAQAGARPRVEASATEEAKRLPTQFTYLHQRPPPGSESCSGATGIGRHPCQRDVAACFRLPSMAPDAAPAQLKSLPVHVDFVPIMQLALLLARLCCHGATAQSRAPADSQTQFPWATIKLQR